jgi:hypothetical protein
VKEIFPIARLGVLLSIFVCSQVVSAAKPSSFDEFAPLKRLVAAASHAKGTLSDFTDFTPRGTQPELDFPLDPSHNCRGCHGGGPLESHFPRNSWMGSMMANATRDPLFWAALDVANQDGIDNDAEGIGDYCLRCHSPSGWYAGRVRKVRDVDPDQGVNDTDIVDGSNGCLLQGDHDNTDVAGNDYGGIGCHLCHRQLAEGPFGQPQVRENADAWIDDVECVNGNEPCRGGPYNDYPVALPDGGTFDEPPHAWEPSHFQSSSEACGTCHDVTTPMLESGPFRTLILDDGSQAGNDTQIPFPAERTYSEWASSDFANVVFRDGIEDGGAAIAGQRLATGESCQSCHMPQAQPQFPGDEMFVCGFGPPRNDNLRVHEFAGGNTWIPAILKGEYPNLAASEVAFDNTIAWANRMLTQQSALVDTTATLGSGGTVLTANVKVTNLSGHKLPTGYAEGRRMWIEVEVRDGANAVVWSNGAFDPGTGALAIDAQTKIYEIKQGIWDGAEGECSTEDAQGREKFHFVLNDCIAKDNRIPPLGFTGAQDPEMASHAYSYAAAPGGGGRTVNFDVTPYTIPVPSGTTFPLSVRATLRFQVASREYMEFLRNQATERGFAAENALCAGGPGRPFDVGPQAKSRGQYAYDLWDSATYGRSPPVNMASDVVAVSP